MSHTWLLNLRPSPDRALRLVCMPPAGGGPASYRGWAEALPWAEVWVANLPGRNPKIGAPSGSIHAAAAAIAEAVAADRRPFALFGHSLGALVAFETGRLLAASGAVPRAVIVSGRRAPSLGDPRPPIADLPDGPFVDAVRARYGATIPPEILADEELRALLLPVLRADLALVERYRYASSSALPCALTACGGNADPHASPADLAAWERETVGPFAVRTFSGGHFYLQEPDGRSALLAALATMIDQPSPVSPA